MFVKLKGLFIEIYYKIVVPIIIKRVLKKKKLHVVFHIKYLRLSFIVVVGIILQETGNN